MRLLCGLLLEKKERRLPAHAQASIPSFPLSVSANSERRWRGNKNRDKEKSRGDRNSDSTCEPIGSLRLWWKCKVESAKNSLAIFIFPPLSSPGYRQNTSGKFFVRNKAKDAKTEGKIVLFFFFPLRLIISDKCVCVCLLGGDLRESGMSHELLSASWNSLFKCDWCTVACLLLLLQMFIFPLVVGILVRKDGWEKERLFENQLGECRQGSASWLCGLGWCAGRFLQVDYSALSHGKQSVEMTQSRVTGPHASLW